MTSTIEELEAKLESLPQDEISIERVDILNGLARGVFYSDISRAHSLAQEAETLSRKLNYAKGLGYSLICISFYNRITTRKLDKSILCAQEALSNLTEIEDQDGQALALNALGMVFKEQEKLADALDCFNQSLGIRQKLGDRIGEAKMIANLAGVYFRMRNYRDALTFDLRAYKILDEDGDLHSKALTLNNIADMHWKLGDCTKALTTYLESLKIYEQIENQRNIIRTLLNLARLNAEMEHYSQAQEYSQRAIQVTEEIGDRYNQAVALQTMGEIQKLLGDKVLALDYLNQSLSIIKEIDAPRIEMEICWDLGELIAEDGSLEKAVKHFNQSLDAAKQVEDKNIRYKVFRSLSSAYEKMGHVSESLEYYKKYHQYQSDISAREADQATKALMFQFEVERSQKEAEIHRLKNVELASALNDLQKANTAKESLIRQLNQKTELLKKRSREDGLTGLYNRRYLDQRLRNEFKLSQRHGRSLAMAMIDIDKFKQINDTLSHNIGDKVIRTVASCIRKSCRTTDDAARFGGDEFVILFPETNAANAVIVCEKVLQAVSAYNWGKIHPDLDIRISIGVADNIDLNSCEEMMYTADQNMYKAKEKGNLVFRKN